MKQECENCGSKKHVYSYHNVGGRVVHLCPLCAFNGGYKGQMSSAAIWALNRRESPFGSYDAGRSALEEEGE